MLFSVNSFLSFASLSVFGNIVVSYASPLPESQLSIQALSEAIAVGFDLTVDYGYENLQDQDIESSIANMCQYGFCGILGWNFL